MSKLQVGVALPMSGTPEAARRAETHGFGGVRVGDHLDTGAPMLDSALTLSGSSDLGQFPGGDAA